MQSSFRPFAVTCKIFASIEAIVVTWFWVGLDIYMLRATSPPRDAIDWGTPAYYHRLYTNIVIESLLTILVVIPNRWLVFSRITFIPSFVISLLPLGFSLFLICTEFDILFYQFLETLEFWAITILLSAPWPLSVILSRIRFRRGEVFVYA